MIRTALLTACLAGALGPLAGSASAYDRPPIPLTGLHPDRWGQSVTSAESNLKRRYPGISSVTCFGAVIPGESRSSWVDGMTRYWDKLVCGGKTRRGHDYALVYDQKGAKSWTIYRLRGVALDELYG